MWAKQSTENKQTEQKAATLEGPGKDFDWDAKVAPVGEKAYLYWRKFWEKVLPDLTKLETAQSKLEEKRKSITDKKSSRST